MMKKRQVLLLMVALGMTLSACAALRAHNAKNQHIYGKMQNLVFEQPLQTVWPTARTILFEYGYSVSIDGETANTLETDWKREDNGSSSRMLVQGIVIDKESCKVIFTKLNSAANGKNSSARSHALEWELVQRVDPATAAQIEQEASTKGEAAR